MTGSEIAEVLELPLSTVSLWLKRIGLGKRSRLEPPEPPNRYERRHPGELVHVDIKQLGRIRLGAGHRVTGSRASQKRAGQEGQRRGVDRLGVPTRDHRRPQPPRLRRGARRPQRTLARCVPASSRRLVRPTRRPRPGRNERQRLLLHQRHVYAADPRRARSQPPQDQAETATHQRQSRTADPDPAQRMGIQPHLRQLNTNEPQPSPTTSTATTTADHTAASATNHRPRD